MRWPHADGATVATRANSGSVLTTTMTNSPQVSIATTTDFSLADVRCRSHINKYSKLRHSVVPPAGPPLAGCDAQWPDAVLNYSKTDKS
jgi:hypothetical protein